MKFLRILTLAAILGVPSLAAAADPVALMTQAFDRGKAKSSTATLEMILKAANGSENKRELKMESLGRDKQLMWFVAPNDLRGTALLNLKEEGVQKTWLYLPAFKNTNRVSGKRKRDSFMGSEFTYEDMNDRKVEDFEFTYLKEDSLKGVKVHLIEGKVKDKDSAYSKIVFYVDDGHKEIQKTDMYSVAGDLAKVMTINKIEVIDGRRIPTQMEMKTLADGDSTLLNMKSVKVDVEIPESHFSERYLPKVN